jgi:hypothetical protein
MGPGRPYPDEFARVDLTTKALGLSAAEREPWDTFAQYMLPAMWDFHPYQADPAEPQPLMDAMVEFTRGWQPDLVIWDPCLPGAAVAARTCGAAHARWWTGPDYFAWSMDRLDDLAGRTGERPENPLLETVRPVCERYGLDVDEETLLGQWTITHLPEGMRLPVRTRAVTVRWIPYSAQTPMPDWLYPKPEKPRIAVSLGLSWRMYFKGGWDHVPVLFDALSEMDVEVVATLNETQLEQVGKIPDNIRTVDYLPLDQLLPTCSALIHHGGFASFAVAAAAGVPQLITDSSDPDVTALNRDGGMVATKHVAAPVTTRYVTDHDAGLILDVREPTAEYMRGQIERVLTEPVFRTGAQGLLDDFLATPSPAEIVPVLEKLTARKRG